MKKITAVLLCLCIAISLLPVSTLAGAQSDACANNSDIVVGTFAGSSACVGKAGTTHAGQLCICEDNFPDAGFRAYVQTLAGAADGWLSTTEAANIKSIYASGKNIASLKGVEYFTAMTTLQCHKNQLISLNVSTNTGLVNLYCQENAITSLDVSANTNLKLLNCGSNALTALDVSTNEALVELYCGGNKIPTLNVSANTKLKKFYCQKNLLTALDVSANTMLTNLRCDVNTITALDVSANTVLTTLYCFTNALTALDVSANTALTDLRCYDNALTALDVSANTALTTLNCSANALTALDVSANTGLTTLYCYSNALTALDVSANTELADLRCNANALTELELSANTALSKLFCGNNTLTALDLSHNGALTSLNCANAGLTELDLSANTELTALAANNNAIDELDLSANTKLTTLNVYGTQISELDLSHNTALKEVDCYITPISSLELGNIADKSAVTTLYYRNTRIPTMDISEFTGLTSLSVTKQTGFSAAATLVELYVTGSRAVNDTSFVRLKADAGSFFCDGATGYFMIEPNNAGYGYNMACEGSSSGFVYVADVNMISLPAGGLADCEGNLVPGAAGVDYTVSPDGVISVAAGGSIVTPTGKYIFADGATLADGVITTYGETEVTVNEAHLDENDSPVIGVEIPSVTLTPLPNRCFTLVTCANTGAIPAFTTVAEAGGNTWVTAAAGTLDMVTGEVDAAVYHPPVYTLYFNTNGGSKQIGLSRDSGTVIELAQYVPTREGYAFTGWYSDEALTEKITSVKLTKTTTVYAGWAEIKPSVAELHRAFVFGYTDGTVRPDEKITRAEAITMLYRVLTDERRDEIFTEVNSFTDVPKERWYNKAVSSMAAGGYINGFPDGTFGGEKTVDRAEFAAMLARVAGVSGGSAEFADVSRENWAYKYIAAVCERGWMSSEDGAFEPDREVTRAEAAAAINAMLGRGISAAGVLAGITEWSDNADPNAWYYFELIEAGNSHVCETDGASESWTRLVASGAYDAEKYEKP